jgi:hypothetical protein
MLRIVTADERLEETRGAKILLVGPTGVGKTSQLRTLDPKSTLFIDIEAGDLAIKDVGVDTIHLNDWPAARDLAVRISGPNPSFGPMSCYGEAHYRAVGGDLPNLDRYSTIFIDSITALSRLSFRWAEQQPEAFSERSGKKDLRGVYGAHAREMITLLNVLQHVRNMNVVFVSVLELVRDEFGHADWKIQMEGARTGRELPGIVDEIVTMQMVDFGDGKELVRSFICTSPNPWNYPAKDRSGLLSQLEKPDLGGLLKKLSFHNVQSAQEK